MTTTDHSVEAPAVRRALLAATPWFVDARLRRAGDGWHAWLRLDPRMAFARAEQQGLRDTSLAAAAKDAGVLRTLDGYIARVNDRLPAGDRIVARTFATDAADAPPSTP